MNADAAQVIALLFKLEGGAVDDPRDPGGRTAYGITQATFDAWQDAHKKPRRDVFSITKDEARVIYFNRYAEPTAFYILPPGVDLCVMDEAVNSGPVFALKELQAVLGVDADGALGQITRAAIFSIRDPLAVIDKLCERRLGFMRRLKAWITYGRGWSARVSLVRQTARQMAVASDRVLHA